jgi:uncharacterized membrane protein YvbJ
MVTCQACGTDNPPGAAFCSQCARKLDDETQSEVVRTREAHTATGVDWSRVAMAALAAVIVILVVALLVTHVI